MSGDQNSRRPARQPISLRNLSVRRLPRLGSGVGACPACPDPVGDPVGAVSPSFSFDLQLLTFGLAVRLSPLAATLMDLPASVANKRLTACLSPLAATLTRNRGVGATRERFFTLLHIQPASHLPYTLPSSVSRKPFVCHSYENCRGVYQQFPFWNYALMPETRPGNRDAFLFHGSRFTVHGSRFSVRHSSLAFPSLRRKEEPGTCSTRIFEWRHPLSAEPGRTHLCVDA